MVLSNRLRAEGEFMNLGNIQSRRRRYCAWLGMVALLLQLAVPLGQGLRAAAFGGGQGEAGKSLVLCMLLSSVSRPAHEDGHKPGSEPGAPADFCPVCLARTLSGNLLAAAPAVLARPVEWAEVAAPTGDRIPDPARRQFRRLARAPPSLA